MRPWHRAVAVAVVALALLAVPFVAPRSAYMARSDASLPAAFVKVEHEKGHGSGVHIGDGYIVTAAHVTGGRSEVSIRSTISPGVTTVQTGTVLWENTKYDIALVMLEQPALIGSARLSCRVAQVGEEIRAVGNPMNIGGATSWGRVAGDVRHIEGSKWASVLIADMTIVMGQSGGAVLDKDGNVVGIAVGVYLASLGFAASLTGFAAVVPSSVVCHLMGRSE